MVTRRTRSGQLHFTCARQDGALKPKDSANAPSTSTHLQLGSQVLQRVEPVRDGILLDR